MKLLDIIYESILLEYSHKLVDQLVDKFSEEGIDPEHAREYISLFHRYSQGLNPEERDITKYSWDDLYKTVNDRKDRKQRIKAGKIGDKYIDKDDIVYNNDGIMIYKGDSMEKCIRYGNGYGFCVSSRGYGNPLERRDYEGRSYVYWFVFNNNLNKDDPNHLLVLDNQGDGTFVVWNALNEPVDTFEMFSTSPHFPSIGDEIPWLKGLEYIFE